MKKTPGYQDKEEDYDERHRPRHEKTIALLKSLIASGQLPAKGKALNLGSLPDDATCRFLQQSGWEVKGFLHDLRLQHNLQDVGADLVLCLETIEHVKDDPYDWSMMDISRWTGSGIKNMISSARSALKQGGTLLLSTPNPHSLQSFLNWSAGSSAYNYEPHPRELTVPQLEELLHPHFTPKNWQYENVWGVPQGTELLLKQLQPLVGAHVRSVLGYDVLFVVSTRTS